MLRECAKIAPIVRGGSHLQHMLAFVIMQPATRAASVQEIGSLEEALKEQDWQRAQEETQDTKAMMTQAKSERMAVDLVKKGKRKVVVLDEAQCNRFAQYCDTAKNFLRNSL